MFCFGFAFFSQEKRTACALGSHTDDGSCWGCREGGKKGNHSRKIVLDAIHVKGKSQDICGLVVAWNGERMSWRQSTQSELQARHPKVISTHHAAAPGSQAMNTKAPFPCPHGTLSKNLLRVPSGCIWALVPPTSWPKMLNSIQPWAKKNDASPSLMAICLGAKDKPVASLYLTAYTQPSNPLALCWDLEFIWRECIKYSQGGIRSCSSSYCHSQGGRAKVMYWGHMGSVILTPHFLAGSLSSGNWTLTVWKKAALDAHNLKFDVSSVTCMHTSCWAHAAAVVLVPARTRARGSVGMSQQGPAKPRLAKGWALTSPG